MIVCFGSVLNVFGVENPAGLATGDTKEKTIKLTNITVAIIDFEANAPGNPELGRQISDILTARLSIYDQFKLIERQKLKDVLKEHQLNLTGMADTTQVVNVGKLLGARIMIFGKAFTVDKDLYIVAKIIGTETSQVKGVMAKGKLESNLSDIIDEVTGKLADGLDKWAQELLPKDEQIQNKIEILKQQLGDKKLPTVAIIVPEVHVNQLAVDPAAETEMKKIFQEVGFNIIEIRNRTISQWARDFLKDPGQPIPPDLTDVNMIIVGEGFSEFGARIGELVSCTARLEINVINKEDGKVIASERITKRAVDLSELIAGKTALQAAGHELAIEAIEKISSQLSDVQKSEKDLKSKKDVMEPNEN
jgi:hypothetical protein